MSLHAFFTDKTLRVAAIAVALVAFGAHARPRSTSYVANEGVPVERFWAEKAAISRSLDVALAGDSRVFRGLAPAAMKFAPGSGVRDLRVFNLGFSGVALADPYLAYIEDALDPASTKKLIVVGVTAHEFTEHANIDNGYLEERRRTRADTLERIYLSPVRQEFRPIAPEDVWFALTRRDDAAHERRYEQDFHDDGFVASRLIPEEPDHALAEYAKMFATSKVDEARVSFFVDRVRAWKTRGIRVVGFRPPTSRTMMELEAREGHFDEARVRDAFVGAGGEWLTIDSDLYATYDGSHLRADDAQRFSRDVAAMIAQ